MNRLSRGDLGVAPRALPRGPRPRRSFLDGIGVWLIVLVLVALTIGTLAYGAAKGIGEGIGERWVIVPATHGEPTPARIEKVPT